MGDLVRKLGEKILPEIIPILEEGLRSQKSDERQGVCIGLSEIMKSTSRDAVSIFRGPCSDCVCVRVGVTGALPSEMHQPYSVRGCWQQGAGRATCRFYFSSQFSCQFCRLRAKPFGGVLEWPWETGDDSVLLRLLQSSPFHVTLPVRLKCVVPP